jgi:WD40 repeat protein
VYGLAFDPSGRYLAGAGLTDHLYMWDLTTGEQVFDLDGHQERVNVVAFSPDGNYLLSGSDDLTIRVWDVLSGRRIVVREFDSPVQSMAFSPDGKVLFTGNGNTTCYSIELAKLIHE